MELSELCPIPVFVEWAGHAIQLKPFSLRAIAWAERFFFKGSNGFERMLSILKNEEGQEVFFNTVIDLVYYLGSDDFKGIGVGSVITLKKEIAGLEDKLTVIKEFKTALEEVLSLSFPEPKKQPPVTGGKIFQQLQKNKPKKSGHSKTNWEQVYIEFYRAGGMTLDEFLSMTSKQVSILIEEIRFNKFEYLNLLSDITQKKITIKKPSRKVNDDFTDEDLKVFEREHKRMVAQNRIN